jgi:hypothetical protein
VKVFKKLGLSVSKNEINDIIAGKHMAIENLLIRLYDKVLFIINLDPKIQARCY